MNSTDMNILIQSFGGQMYFSWVYIQSVTAGSEAGNCLGFIGARHCPQCLLIYTSIVIYETSSCFTSSQTVAIGNKMSQTVHSLIPITCKYAMFCGKKTLQIYTENSLLIQFLSEDLLSSLLLKSGPTLYILSSIIRKMIWTNAEGRQQRHSGSRQWESCCSFL